MHFPFVTLNDGYNMPFFGFGTYELKGPRGEAAIRYAIEVGYRHIDTANFYANEKEVGNAIREKIENGTIKREDIFVTTKLSLKMHNEKDVVISCKESLEKLGLDYIDLFLIHTPVSLKEVELENAQPTNIDYVETWRGMEECKNQGLTRSIGVSNFNSQQLIRLISNSIIKPAINEIEVTLNLPQKSLIEFCKIHDIYVLGYSPLGKGDKHSYLKNISINPKIKELMKKYGKTSAQISLRFVLQVGAAPIPKSANKLRIKENFEIFDFRLSDEEMNELLTIGTGERVVKFDYFRSSKYFPFDFPF